MDDFAESEPQSLARMMRLDESAAGLWEPDELGAILQHQLDAPLELDLGRLGPAPLASVRAHTCAGPPIHSFRDLFDHPSPPVELLEWSKEFAKFCRTHGGGPVPDEVATVIYFLSIVTAMTRCDRRISRLDDQSLRYGLRWTLKQPWLDEATKRCFRRALDGLKD